APVASSMPQMNASTATFVNTYNKAMRAFILLIAIGITAGSLAAQTTSAVLAGRVTDETGAPVAGARVDIANVETNEAQSFRTGADGNFSALQLPVGSYRLVIAKDGFRTLEQPKVELQLDETVRLDFVMRPGDPAQRLVIEPTEIVMDTEDANVG